MRLTPASAHRKQIGGWPLLASISNIPRLLWARSGAAHLKHIDLHQKYGKLVRLGPNSISIGDATEVLQIYGTTGPNFGKSDFYQALQPMIGGQRIHGLFHTQDESLHRAMKRPIAAMYSMSNLVEFEPHVDTTIKFFLQRVDEMTARVGGGAIDLGTWLQLFAFDVMGEITFSKRLGFLDEGRDIEGIMASIWKIFKSACWIGQMPWLDLLWLKNPYINKRLPKKGSPIVAFALDRMRERAGERSDDDTDKAKSTAGPASRYSSRDFLSQFMEIKASNADIPDWYLMAWTSSNMLAGSDTTAIMLRAIIYFLLKNPASLHKIQSELETAKQEGRLSAIVTWKESRSLPYLDACVKEAGRLHPAVGLTLERVVPRGGATICGEFFREGTIVGMSPWVVHRDRDVFGPDADDWNPDRWLCEKPQRAAMERSLLTFGAGHRTCLGKNISYLEIYKLIPTLFARYTLTLPNPNMEWELSNHWLVTQKGLIVNLQKESTRLSS
ncbi:hypothetical protein E8E14_009139 [Neopestalotiopsis sp. 37M]|nr:hypothetical protein E8E14_009139 [Neopestalotiopsis sp. 37M]